MKKAVLLLSLCEAEHYTHYVLKGDSIDSGWEYSQDAKDHVKDSGGKVVHAKNVDAQKKLDFHKRNKIMGKLKK